MEIIEKEVIKEHGDKKYASRATGNAALTTGIIGTALGAMSLFGNNNCGGGVLGNLGFNRCGNACGPTAFLAWEKSCEDALAAQKGLYDWALVMQNNRFNDRQVIDREMFGLYKSLIDADFGLYKTNRDSFDVLNAKINDLETKVAVNSAVRPYQDKLIQCEIDKAYNAGINYTDKKTCRMITGQVILPTKPEILGFGSYDPCCPVVEEK